MKFKFSLITFVLLSIVLTVTSCRGKQSTAPKDEYVPGTEAAYDVNAKDTAEVNVLLRNFVGYLHNGDIDDAMAMLHHIDGFNKVQPIPDSLISKHRMMLEIFSKKYKYELDKFYFHRETDNLVKVRVTLENLPEEDKRPNTMSFYLRPVRIDNVWYLSLADTDTERNTNHNSEIPT